MITKDGVISVILMANQNGNSFFYWITKFVIPIFVCPNMLYPLRNRDMFIDRDMIIILNSRLNIESQSHLIKL